MTSQETRETRIAEISDDMLLTIPTLYRRMVKPTNKSENRFSYTHRIWVLIILKRKGPSSIISISDKIGYSKQNMTAIIDSLEKDKLLIRSKSETDRRTTIISITDEGVNFLNESKIKFRKTISKKLEDLSDEEIEDIHNSVLTLHRLLPKLLV